MPHILSAQMRTLCIVTAVFCGVINAHAQDANRQRHATGLLLAEPEVLEQFPRSPTYRLFLPETVDFSSRMPEVGDQGTQGSCVGWAVGYAARSYYQSASNGVSLNSNDNIASPAYIYDTIRRKGCDSGSFTHEALELLKTGTMSHADYPYDDQLCRRPSLQEQRAASAFTIRDWQRIEVDKPDQVKGALAMGHPVIVSALVDDTFFRLSSHDIWLQSDAPGPDDGGHAITLVGYDDRTRTFKFINSWGTYWGTDGYGTMSYETFNARVRAAYRIIPFEDPVLPYIDPQPEPAPDPVKPSVELPVFECSRLETASESGLTRKKIMGFVSSQDDLDTLQTDFGAAYQIDVKLRPWPQCEALLIVSGSENRINGLTAPSLALGQTRFMEDELLVIEAQMPSFSGYLHLAYFQADGSVVNLHQAATSQSLQTLLPNETIIMGDGNEGRPKFTVSGPFGAEMILAIATRSPLFSTPRPVIETERAFLSALRASTINFEQNGGRFYAAAEVPIQTAAGGSNPQWMPPQYGPQSPLQ